MSLWDTPAGTRNPFGWTDADVEEMNAALEKLTEDDIRAILDEGREELEKRLRPYRTKINYLDLFKTIDAIPWGT